MADRKQSPGSNVQEGSGFLPLSSAVPWCLYRMEVSMLRRFALLAFVILLSSAVFAQATGTQAQSGAAQQQSSGASGQSAGTAAPAAATAGQPAAAPAPFELADIHNSAKTQFPFMQGPVLRGDRYQVKDATMLDLIATAYSMESEKVMGGPAWIENDRFDIAAKAPAGTSQHTLKLMLQALLLDRFKLAVHPDTKPMQVYVLAQGKGKLKIKESDGTGEPACMPQQQGSPQQGAVVHITVSCHNMTMDSFATTIHQFAGGYLTSPVTNSTNLKGSYDFDFKWSPRQLLAQQGSDGISIFDAMDKQLGLSLELQKIPQPVLVVDSVNEKPTPNPPGVESTASPVPTEFEVAVIKPSRPDEQPFANIDKSGTVNIQGFPLKSMITIAWNLSFTGTLAIVDAPKWLDSAKYDITAKTSTSGEEQQLDFDQLRAMLQKLLEDRWGLKAHMEDRPTDAYTLIAANPKMKKADPMGRTGCKNGPGPDGKDPRIANPILSRLVSCTNITMAQFAEQLQTIAGGYVFQPVEDATHLEGAYDFTLSFSPLAFSRARDAASAWEPMAAHRQSARQRPRPTRAARFRSLTR